MQEGLEKFLNLIDKIDLANKKSGNVNFPL